MLKLTHSDLIFFNFGALPKFLHYITLHYSASFPARNYYRAMHYSAKRGLAIACRLSVRLSVRPWSWWIM